MWLRAGFEPTTLPTGSRDALNQLSYARSLRQQGFDISAAFLGFNVTLPGKGITFSIESLQMYHYPVFGFPRKTLMVGKVLLQALLNRSLAMADVIFV